LTDWRAIFRSTREAMHGHEVREYLKPTRITRADAFRPRLVSYAFRQLLTAGYGRAELALLSDAEVIALYRSPESERR